MGSGLKVFDDDDFEAFDFVFWILFGLGLFLFFLSLICACRRSCQIRRGFVVTQPVIRTYGGTGITIRTVPAPYTPYPPSNPPTGQPGPVYQTPYPTVHGTQSYMSSNRYTPSTTYNQAPPSYYEATRSAFQSPSTHEGYMKQAPYNPNVL